MTSLVGLVSQYLLYFAAVYGATVVIYFATGIGITFINRRHPERRIQKGRNGDTLSQKGPQWRNPASKRSAVGFSEQKRNQENAGDPLV